MATSSQKQYLTNQIIPQYVPHNLKWFAKEGINQETPNVSIKPLSRHC